MHLTLFAIIGYNYMKNRDEECIFKRKNVQDITIWRRDLCPLILITFTNVGSNSQTFSSQNLSKSNSIPSAYDDASMKNIPQDKSNFSINNPLMTSDKNIISILPLNQNQIELQVDPIILDKLTSNSTLGNNTSNPLRSPWYHH